MFCAVGIVNSVAGCQLKFSPLFKSLDQATAAATALGRPQWLVAKWRTDQCGSLQIAATSEGQCLAM
jgi:hypothetical protein